MKRRTTGEGGGLIDDSPLCSDQNDGERKSTDTIPDSHYSKNASQLAACGDCRRLRRSAKLLIKLLSVVALIQLTSFFNPLSQLHCFLFVKASQLPPSQPPRSQNVRSPPSECEAIDKSDALYKTTEGSFLNFLRRGKKPVKGFTDLGSEAASHLYDAIIVGGGAAGCPLARTLADSGKEVLLIERGGARTDHPETLDIYGAGIVIDNKKVAQPILTTDGVISHIGAVLSGGSAINMAIIVEELDEFIDYLETFPGVKYDRNRLKKAYDWVLPWLSHPMPENDPYGKRWREGLEKVYGPNSGYETGLAINSSWLGSSAFDSNNDWFRVAADVSLGQPGVDFPESLHVLLHHNVHKIDFVLDPSTGNHRATCVQYSRTTGNDIASIGKKKNTNIFGFPALFALFGHKTRDEFSAFIPSGPKFRACVKPGGQIISSAGAVLTPLLMYKSGVGPRDVVKKLRVPLVKDFPEIGRGLRDRVLIPVGLFFNDSIATNGHPPRICQSIALSMTGPNCNGFGLGSRSPSCSYTIAEELSGARIPEGTIYATRYIVPPQIRNDPFVRSMFQVSRDCAEGRTPLNNILLTPLCVLSQPLADCFRKVAANFYFTAQPESVADIHVTSKGDYIISGNYLEDPKDLMDAVRGVANIIRVVNTNVYDGIFQPAGLNSCPFKILNALLNLADNELMKLQDLGGMSANSGQQNIDEIKKFLHNAVNEYEVEAKKAEEWKRREEEALTNSTIGDSSDVDRELEGSWFHLFGNPDSKIRPYWTSQRYATYPPTIPEPTDIDGLKRFAKSFMTSIWHWVGSAQMGSVVDDKFVVKGFDNLRIVDASVLNQVTRLNPFYTLVSIGRYAGLLINEADK